MEFIRLNKYLSEAGVCSRREADRLILEGKVIVDGKIALMGLKVSSGQVITCNGAIVLKEVKPILMAVNKPKGIVCTTDSHVEKDNIVDFIDYPQRIYPIGRLDKESEGLILMTNQGEIVNKILRGSNDHDKEYVVTVNKPLTKVFLDTMSSGVPILDTMTKECEIFQTGKQEFHIIIRQGLNRQIRRMCEYLDYRVVSLKRIRIMNIKLGNLKTGAYRNVSEEELSTLKKRLEGSSNLSYKENCHERGDTENKRPN